MRKANGRVHLHLLGTLVDCNGTALSVLSRGVVVSVFRDALDCCAATQNPGEDISRDGSSDWSVGCLELREECRKHHADVLSEVHWSPWVCEKHIRPTRNLAPHLDPTTVCGQEASASQSAKASPMILRVLALLARRQAALSNSPATKSTCSSSITARTVRSSFFPIPRFLE